MRMLSLVITFFILPSLLHASELILKSGQKIEGKILEKTDKYVNIDSGLGVGITYYVDEIDTLDGQKLLLPAPKPLPKITSTDSAVVTPSVKKTVQNNLASQALVEISKPVDNKLPFSTAIILYRYEGGMQGSGQIYIDLVHNRIDQEDNFSSSFITGSSGGQTSANNQRTMYDGNNVYQFEYRDNIAIQMPVQKSAVEVMFKEQDYIANYLGQGTVLDKDCKIYKFDVGKLYFWNGIVLKQDVTDNPISDKFNYKKEAVDIQVDVPIPDEKFVVPDGIKIIGEQEAMKLMQDKFKALGNRKSFCPFIPGVGGGMLVLLAFLGFMVFLFWFICSKLKG
jgi:hypothetical protein